MSTLASIQDFLRQKRLAIVGVSHNSRDFSRKLYEELRGRGYEVVPVNPNLGELAGDKCFAKVQDIQPPVDGALLMNPPALTAGIVRDCEAAGIKRVWMYRAAGSGAVDDEAVLFCQTHGISVVPGECPYMFFPAAGWIHRAHGSIRRIMGAFPH